MSQVRATAVGYYGNKRRDPPEEFGLADRKEFSSAWMEAIGWDPKTDPIDPLDHDGDGRKGGSKPAEGGAKPLTEREIAKNEAITLGLEFPANIPTPKLLELIAAKKAEVAAASAAASDAGSTGSAPPPGSLSDDDKILKALEISGRTDDMTLAEAEAIIASATTDI